MSLQDLSAAKAASARSRRARKEVSVFHRFAAASDTAIKLTVDGREIEAMQGDSVAGALLAAGVGYTRLTPVAGTPRAPYCMMGVCFDCLVTIDGVGNRRGCMVPVRDGMRIETQRGKREVGR